MCLSTSADGQPCSALPGAPALDPATSPFVTSCRLEITIFHHLVLIHDLGCIHIRAATM